MSGVDEIFLVSRILTHQCLIVPDLNYLDSKWMGLKTIDEFSIARRRTRSFFIINESLLESPLEMREISRDGKPSFYISPRSGGPAVQFLSSGAFIEGGKTFFRSGFLSTYSAYWSTKTDMQMKPSAQFSAFYKALQAVVREEFIRIVVRKESVWLGAETQEAVLAGARLAGFENFDCVQELLKKKQGKSGRTGILRGRSRLS